MSVQIRYECEALDLDKALVRRQARRILGLIGHAKDELSIVFVDDARMRELNRDYRGIDRTTDVLAFPQEDGEPRGDEDRPPAVLGDIAVSIPTAKRQASRYGHPLLMEVRRLLVHGAVHLSGHDHKTPSQARAMRAEERRVLLELGEP